ncbi:alpha/beta hydrolase [Actinomadura sp. 9N407]|uniref:alpha/beta hydrolase n=1 Tax=Actinomadura sp. 9N407 TaxID=3375154 RepID=UPI003787C389
MSFAQLRDAKLDDLDAAWRGWRKTVERLEQAEDAYNGKFLQGIRGSGWQGQDAQAALRTLVPAKTRIRVAAAEAAAIASVINTGQRRFKRAQLKLTFAISSAQSEYLRVGDDGSISFPDALPPRYSSWQELQQAARRIQGRFELAIKEATEADTQIAHTLRDLGPNVLDSKNPQAGVHKDALLAAKMAGFEASNVPPVNAKDPSAIASWWKGLPEEQRHLLMNAFPEKIGWLNGIPSEDRDEANRTHVNTRIAELQAKEDYLSKAEQRDLKRLTDLDKAISAYEAKGKDMYVLGLDITTMDPAELRDGQGSDGRAIVAFGNPDTAKHSAVYVPGTADNIDKLGGVLNRAFNLNEATGMFTDGSVSTVAWLGYDTPDDMVKDAPFGNYADAGGAKLNDFVDGIRETQSEAGNGGAHMTAVGHSYGSTVIGEAARHEVDRLSVDDIVVAGSPGMRVEKAADLGIGSDHVWVQEARGEAISLGRLGHGGGYFPGPPNAPSDEDFGAQRLATDGQGHSDYWKDKPRVDHADPRHPADDRYTFGRPSLSLEQQARVIAGTHADGDLSNDPIRYGQGGPQESKETWWQRLL